MPPNEPKELLTNRINVLYNSSRNFVWLVFMYGGIEMEEKEKYKEEIKEVIDSIDDIDILEYFHYFITEKMKKAV